MAFKNLAKIIALLIADILVISFSILLGFLCYIYFNPDSTWVKHA